VRPHSLKVSIGSLDREGATFFVEDIKLANDARLAWVEVLAAVEPMGDTQVLLQERELVKGNVGREGLPDVGTSGFCAEDPQVYPPLAYGLGSVLLCHLGISFGG
jgi:hypothetical protein